MDTLENYLIPVNSAKDIPEKYRETPIGLLLEYQNLDRPFDAHSQNQAQMLVGMCMDNRKQLHIPDNFSYILRSGGANLRNNEFKISYAVGVGGVRYLALIGHTQCGMVNLHERKDLFVEGLVKNGGWTRAAAIEHFEKFAPQFEIVNEADFVLSEVSRLRLRYPKITLVPMLYKVEDSRLYLLKE